MKRIGNPFQFLPPHQLARLNADVPQSLVIRIRSVCPYKGIVQDTINTLLSAFENELKRLGINFYCEENSQLYATILDNMCSAAFTPRGSFVGARGQETISNVLERSSLPRRGSKGTKSKKGAKKSPSPYYAAKGLKGARP